jgi:catechol 2,3-dioxygenase-like lactoylglutathione lyase family enzyme
MRAGYRARIMGRRGESMRIHHTAISTPNLERLVDFYERVFHFKRVSGFGWPRGVGSINAVLGLADSAAKAAMLRSGDSMLELFEFAQPVPKPQNESRPVSDHGYTHICLLVEDVDEEQARCEALGMKFHCPAQKTDELWFTYGRDPDGNVIELLKVLKPEHPMAIRAA